MSNEIRPFIENLRTNLCKKYPYLTISNMTLLLRYAIVTEVMCSGDEFVEKPWFQDIVIREKDNGNITEKGIFKVAQEVFSQETDDVRVRNCFEKLFSKDMTRISIESSGKATYKLNDFYKSLEAKLEELESIKENYPVEFLSFYENFLCLTREDMENEINEATKLSGHLTIDNIVEYIQSNPTAVYVTDDDLWVLFAREFVYRFSLKTNLFYRYLTTKSEDYYAGTSSDDRTSYSHDISVCGEGALSSKSFTEADRYVVNVTAYKLGSKGEYQSVSPVPFKALVKMFYNFDDEQVEELNAYYIRLLCNVRNLEPVNSSGIKGFGDPNSEVQKVRLALRKEHY